MPRSYTPEFKKKIVRLHLAEGRTYKSITAEYGVSKASISAWCSEFSKECQAKAIADPGDLSRSQWSGRISEYESLSGTQRLFLQCRYGS